MKNFVSLRLLIALLVLLAGSTYDGAQAREQAPRRPLIEHSIIAPAYVLMDVETGRVLASRNMHEKRFPASTTKTMTALLAIEKGDLDSVVTISKNPPKIGESSIYLQEGERLTLRELVEAAMIKSANDSTVAIAEGVAGSEKKFVAMMNARAKQLGAKDTHFVNPHGLHDPNHFTTAYDLALIAREALKHPDFNEIIAMHQAFIKGHPKLGGMRKITNLNKLLFRWEEADGVKTGTTRQAGGCLIASATRIDPVTHRPWRLLSVVLHSKGKWSDSASLLIKQGFEKYAPTVVAHGGEQLAEVTVEGGEKPVRAVAEKELRLPLLPIEQSNLVSRVHPLEREAPIRKGQTIAWLEWSLNNHKIASVPLVARDEVDKSLMAKILPASAPLMPSQPFIRWSVYALAAAGIVFLLVGWKVRTDEHKRKYRRSPSRKPPRRLID